MGHRSLLKHLHIRDFAVIEEVDIAFNDGLTVFTGETGAGKSIMVGALGLVLGDRSDSGIVRTGCERTEITAIFDIENEDGIQSVLAEQEINCEDELILRRVINKDGRSRAYVNGSSVPAQLLRALGERMVDIHGQHTHQSLLKADVQRNLLDEFGNHQQQLNEVKDAWKLWHATELELQALSGDNGAKLFPRVGDSDPTLLRRRLVENSNVDAHSDIDPAVTANNHILYVGDWSNYVILDRVGLSVTFVPPGFLKGAGGRPDGRVGWYAYWRVGGESLVDGAFRVLDIATTL